MQLQDPGQGCIMCGPLKSFCGPRIVSELMFLFLNLLYKEFIYCGKWLAFIPSMNCAKVRKQKKAHLFLVFWPFIGDLRLLESFDDWMNCDVTNKRSRDNQVSLKLNCTTRFLFRHYSATAQLRVSENILRKQ